jgi:hypothetical protein
MNKISFFDSMDIHNTGAATDSLRQNPAGRIWTTWGRRAVFSVPQWLISEIRERKEGDEDPVHYVSFLLYH